MRYISCSTCLRKAYFELILNENRYYLQEKLGHKSIIIRAEQLHLNRDCLIEKGIV